MCVRLGNTDKLEKSLPSAATSRKQKAYSIRVFTLLWQQRLQLLKLAAQLAIFGQAALASTSCAMNPLPGKDSLPAWLPGCLPKAETMSRPWLKVELSQHSLFLCQFHSQMLSLFLATVTFPQRLNLSSTGGSTLARSTARTRLHSPARALSQSPRSIELQVGFRARPAMGCSFSYVL